MPRKLVLLLFVLGCLAVSTPVLAYPWGAVPPGEDPSVADELNNYLSLTHLNPTYLTFSGHDDAGNIFNATIYMDITRDYAEDRLGRSYYARYVSGNIFEGLSNIEGHAGDLLTIPTQEGSVFFDGTDGEFWNYSQPFSSLRTGDYLNFTHFAGGDINMLCTGWSEASAPIPEPATSFMVCVGLAGVGLLRMRLKV